MVGQNIWLQKRQTKTACLRATIPECLSLAVFLPNVVPVTGGDSGYPKNGVNSTLPWQWGHIPSI